jgi:hypothetical protein
VVTIAAKAKKKLIAGGMSASVAAAMSASPRTPRASRPSPAAPGPVACDARAPVVAIL